MNTDESKKDIKKKLRNKSKQILVKIQEETRRQDEKDVDDIVNILKASLIMEDEQGKEVIQEENKDIIPEARTGKDESSMQEITRENNKMIEDKKDTNDIEEKPYIRKMGLQRDKFFETHNIESLPPLLMDFQVFINSKKNLALTTEIFTKHDPFLITVPGIFLLLVDTPRELFISTDKVYRLTNAIMNQYFETSFCKHFNFVTSTFKENVKNVKTLGDRKSIASLLYLCRDKILFKDEINKQEKEQVIKDWKSGRFFNHCLDKIKMVPPQILNLQEYEQKNTFFVDTYYRKFHEYIAIIYKEMNLIAEKFCKGEIGAEEYACKNIKLNSDIAFGCANIMFEISFFCVKNLNSKKGEIEKLRGELTSFQEIKDPSSILVLGNGLKREELDYYCNKISSIREEILISRFIESENSLYSGSSIRSLLKTDSLIPNLDYYTLCGTWNYSTNDKEKILKVEQSVKLISEKKRTEHFERLKDDPVFFRSIISQKIKNFYTLSFSCPRLTVVKRN